MFYSNIKWEDEKENILKMALEDKLSIADIAKSYSVSNQTIRNKIKKYNLFKLDFHNTILLENNISFEYGTEEWKNKCISMFKNKKKNCNGKEFNIEFDDIYFPEYCPVLNIKLVYDNSHVVNCKYKATFDRIDNTKGYIKGNVVVVSMRANFLKRDASIDEIREIKEFVSSVLYLQDRIENDNKEK